jgi:hypothetical protein
MLLLALAVAPGIAICLFIYSLNKYGKEQMAYLVLSFVLGMVATLPALLVQTLAEDVRDEPSRHSIFSYVWYAFIIIALSEEGSKFLVLRFYAYRLKAFTEPFDGVLFSVMIGMGFATVENIEYVSQFGLETGVSRFFLAIPAHASFAVLMGEVPEGTVFMADVQGPAGRGLIPRQLRLFPFSAAEPVGHAASLDRDPFFWGVCHFLYRGTNGDAGVTDAPGPHGGRRRNAGGGIGAKY